MASTSPVVATTAVRNMKQEGNGTDMSGTDTGWPARLSRGAVRLARRSGHYDETIAFYRDAVGLPVLAEFISSFGEDGTIFGLPGSSVHLEVLRAAVGAESPADHDEIVLYLDDAEAVDSATVGLRDAGVVPDPHGHPYWDANGATTYRDPDGRTLVFAPWVFGHVPDPVDRPHDGETGHGPGSGQQAVRIDWFAGERRELRALFEEAEDSARQLDAYIGSGRVLVARIGESVVGHLQLLETGEHRVIELKSMAVRTEVRGTGVGSRLVEHAVTSSRACGHRQMIVATAAADIDNLRFYQRRGFRMTAVEQDAFGEEAGYPHGITIDGIPLRDRVWLAQSL